MHPQCLPIEIKQGKLKISKSKIYLVNKNSYKKGIYFTISMASTV
jgi:hypothetical protein